MTYLLRVLHRSRRVKWPLLLGGVLVALVLGFVGFVRLHGSDRTVLDLVYADLQLFVLEWNPPAGSIPFELQFARFLAPIMAFSATFEALLHLAAGPIQRWRAGRQSGHVVICGMGYIGSRFADLAQRQGWTVVAIERDPLSAGLQRHQALDGLAVVGDARERTVLEAAGVRGARHVIVVAGSDALNAEVALEVARLHEGNPRSAQSCLAHIADTRLRTLLHADSAGRGGDAEFALLFLNALDLGAAALVRKHEALSRFDADTPPRIMVVGTGNAAESIVRRLARRWRTGHPGDSLRLRVDLAGPGSADLVEALAPAVVDACDIRPIEVTPRRLVAEGAELSQGADDSTLAAIVVADEDGAQSVAIALARSADAASESVPVIAALTSASGLGALLEYNTETKRAATIAVEPLLEIGLSEVTLLNDEYEALAKAIQEKYRSGARGTANAESTDPALAPWEKLALEYKDSCRAQALHISTKLRTVGCSLERADGPKRDSVQFTPAEVECMARMEHDRWNDERLDAKWRYGPERDLVAKTSPYLVEWELLPENIREYDRIFVRAIPELVATVGWRVVRDKDGACRA